MTDAHYLDYVVGPAITTKPGYYQVWVIEPECSVPSLLGINQRFEKLFGVDMELHLPMEGSPSFTTAAIVVHWSPSSVSFSPLVEFRHARLTGVRDRRGFRLRLQFKLQFLFNHCPFQPSVPVAAYG